MPLLVIDFQEGFSEDNISVRIDEQEVLYKTDLNTDYSIGLADSFQIQVHKGLVKIDVIVPSRQLSNSIIISVSKTFYLGVSIIDHKINFISSDKMFIYY